MAVTQGHGNPNWNRDETILALEAYFALAGKNPSAKDPLIIALSQTLRALPYHGEAARKSTFRNPDGVAFKVQNLRSRETGKGLGTSHGWIVTFGTNLAPTRPKSHASPHSFGQGSPQIIRQHHRQSMKLRTLSSTRAAYLRKATCGANGALACARRFSKSGKTIAFTATYAA